jgi:hypothetical protein
VLADYTAPWRKGCVPPDAVRWMNPDNNKAFLARRVVLVVNTSLSIPAELRAAGLPAGPREGGEEALRTL